MSWTQIDFSLVRYSPIEGTHFFYDARYPSAVQFLLSGRWESWDVGWVRYKSQDPDIRRIAEEAEARLVGDPQSGYSPWPSPPPPGPPSAIESLQQAAQDHPSPAHLTDPASFSPASPSTQNGQTVASASPHDDGLTLPPTSAGDALYTSPYYRQSSSTPRPMQTPATSMAPPQSTSSGHQIPNSDAAQLYPPSTQGPPLQPAAATGVVLSRNRETKILLSIDGDGIRGLSALLLIESLVNAICVKIGQRLDPHQIFDLTGGSSLGGVIAILLCRLQMQAHRAREAYKQIAKQVFHNKRDFFISLDPQASIPSGNGEALENDIRAVIEQELGKQDERLFDAREDSGDVFVVSTHIEIGTNKAALMRSYQTRRITGPDLDANMTIVQAMKATSVAPRYMLPQPGVNQRLVIEPGLVDHGTAKNNPVRDILYECRKLFRYANDMMIIVSIGTGVGINRFNELNEMVNSVDDRNAEARVWGEKFEADHQALMERGWMKYFRFNVPGLEDVPLEEWCHEDDIKKKTSTYLAQPEVSRMFYACVDEITGLLLGPQGRS
ncbi:FabD/lysophospholipase-like protein [Ophiobolus disseminans]|uniref:FabD/lysophospholipase-like protein n=1 Tax=Ophiobolus disseminans TaxID=1469910 RepID=A0A6A6ZS22_9PLEO|nr:FabD/lysophospholipase-like protein [Ophiobolus disseminans]